MQVIDFARQIPGLRASLWRIRTNYYALLRHLLVRRPVIDGGALIASAITHRQPFMAGKMGSVEALALRTYLGRERTRKGGRTAPHYSSYNFFTLYMNAGVFPQDESMYDRFCAAYLDAAKHADALVAWDVAGEAEILRHYCTSSTLIKIESLDPYFSAAPWSQALSGRRVLVISPFAKSIEQQYAKRTLLWGGREILPLFELITIKAPLSAGLVTPTATDWFAALHNLTSATDAVEYDVMLVGAGAFSLPLAFHAKQQGKVGIHLGGSLQILFGITGERWRTRKEFKEFFNEHWCSPSKEETPGNYKMTEGGCYW